MVLFWSAEEIMVVGFMTAVGMYISHLFSFFLLGLLVVKFYRRINSRQLDGFYLHYLYWVGLMSQEKGRTMPPTATKEFLQ